MAKRIIPTFKEFPLSWGETEKSTITKLYNILKYDQFYGENKVKYENKGNEYNYKWGRYQEGLTKKMTFEQNPKRGDAASLSQEVGR